MNRVSEYIALHKKKNKLMGEVADINDEMLSIMGILDPTEKSEVDKRIKTPKNREVVLCLKWVREHDKVVYTHGYSFHLDQNLLDSFVQEFMKTYNVRHSSCYYRPEGKPFAAYVTKRFKNQLESRYKSNNMYGLIDYRDKPERV